MTNLGFSRRFVSRLVACCFLGLTIYPLAVASSAPTEENADKKKNKKMRGDCTQERHAELQKIVNLACKREMKCTNQLDCATLALYKGYFEACIKAREIVNNECFKGGDPGHNRALDDARGGLTRCTNHLKECNNKFGTCPVHPK